MFDIKEELKKLPDSPGVYLHKDAFGQIIYVGKAVDLSRRVHQYFQSPKNQPPKVREMVRHIAEFEYITTGTEMEALILECNLIKKHRPKYNILLRDDKTYPYIKVTLSEPYPRILKTRRILRDGAKYFGPYTDVGAVNTMIDVLNSAYSFKRCRPVRFPAGHTPCLNYHIHRCRGVCRGGVDRAAYLADIDKAMDFLQGRNREIIDVLKKRMEEASEALDYEEAARLRDAVLAAEAITEKQRVVLARPEDLDIILLTEGLQGAHVILFTVREGKLSGRESFFLGDISGEERTQVVSDFIKQYYYDGVIVPKELLLKEEPAEAGLLADWLSGLRGSRVTINVPERGEKRALMALVKEDVDRMLADIDERAARQIEKDEGVRIGLRMVFGDLGDEIHRIESYDISHTAGMDSVGGMVVFEDGRPLRKAYRRFKIRTVEGGNDDTGSLQEVLFRRFQKAKEGDPGFLPLPDLILMDGGIGQVHAAEAVARALGISVPIAGMAKDDKHRTRAILFREKEVALKDCPQLYAFVGTVQEEVHRFAIDYHRKLRGKGMSRSVLDEIPGIGEKRKLALLAAFGSVDAIKASTDEQLSSVPGMDRRAAEAVRAYFTEREKHDKIKRQGYLNGGEDHEET